MRKAYRDLEDYIVDLFNNIDGVIHWNNKTYDRIAACKPYPQRGGGECKTDVYVLLNNIQEGTSDEIKISVKKDDAEFLANKLKAPVAEDLFGSDWKNILTDNINQIKNKFNIKKNELAFLEPDRKTKEIDANFTLGWKLEVTNKIRELSFPLKLSNSEIIKIVFKGENQPIAKKNAVIFDGIIQENSGIAEYLISGNTDKYSNAQEVIDDLVNLNSYDAGDIYLAFTANNFRYNANKADGARALVIAVEWSIKNNRLYPTIIFDEPLTYEGERNMMPILKECLVQLGINKFSDIDMERIKPNED